ncbi:MAG: PfkB family carbohydrate kinase [Thermomicrobiales bacterium]
MTGGAAGCWANVDGRIAHIQPPEIVAADPTGAGDASFSALIASVQQVGQLSEEGLGFASAAGAITTLTRGDCRISQPGPDRVVPGGAG